MRQFGIISLLAMSLNVLGQRDYVTASYVSDCPFLLEMPIKVQREIYGGTKIHTTYIGDWPYEAMNAYNYACEILEEAMPSTFPISLALRWENSTRKSMSIIRPIYYGLDDDLDILRSQLKAIMYDQVCGDRPGDAYMEEFKDVNFDPYSHDAEITYYNGNNFIMDNCDFSIASTEQDKYDFVSIALRDMIKAMGFVFTSFSPDLIPNRLRKKNQFEKEILMSAGFEDELTTALTQGSYTLHGFNSSYSFYAPTTWMPGVSLNYFMPDPTDKLAMLLAYNFGIGTSVRDISSDKTKDFFRDCLGWRADIPTGVGGPGEEYQTVNGNTSSVIPMGGSIHMDSGDVSLLAEDGGSLYQPPTSKKAANLSVSFNIDDLRGASNVAYDYAVQYHPNNSGEEELQTDAWIVSLLKKDGTWDVVYKRDDSTSPLDLGISGFTKNFADSVYARTPDGYLRCRITQCYCTLSWANFVPKGKSWYYVIEDFPQKTKMKKSKVSGYYDDEYLRTVRIGLLNIEGTDSLVVKQHDEGFSQPYYFSVPDFKKGYVEVVVDRDFTSTIQIRSYNKNGWTDSEEYVIAPVEPTGINVSFDIDNDKIHVNPTSRKYGDATSLISEYTIASVNKSGQQNTIQAAFTRETNDVDVSGLESGIYMLTVSDILGEKHAIKFVR